MLAISPRNPKSSNENIPLLDGQLDIALVAGEPACEAFMGTGRPATHLKILTAIYASPGMFVVRADSPHRSVGDLAPSHVAFFLSWARQCLSPIAGHERPRFFEPGFDSSGRYRNVSTSNTRELWCLLG
jgi:hypothetical protein